MGFTAHLGAPDEFRYFWFAGYPKSYGVHEDRAYRCRWNHAQAPARSQAAQLFRLLDALPFEALLPAFTASPGINHGARILTFQVVPSGWLYFSQRMSSIYHNEVRGKDVALPLLRNKQPAFFLSDDLHCCLVLGTEI